MNEASTEKIPKYKRNRCVIQDDELAVLRNVVKYGYAVLQCESMARFRTKSVRLRASIAKQDIRLLKGIKIRRHNYSVVVNLTNHCIGKSVEEIYNDAILADLVTKDIGKNQGIDTNSNINMGRLAEQGISAIVNETAPSVEADEKGVQDLYKTVVSKYDKTEKDEVADQFSEED